VQLSQKSLLHFVHYYLENSQVFRPCLKETVLLSTEVVGQKVPYHQPCTANGWRPTVESCCRGTTISCCVADPRRRL